MDLLDLEAVQDLLLGPAVHHVTDPVAFRGVIANTHITVISLLLARLRELAYPSGFRALWSGLSQDRSLKTTPDP
jgi:hypothetical protein